jgi:sulfur-carrier protein
VTEIRVALPAHLRTLAKTGREVVVSLPGADITQRAVLDALESAFPVLGGTIRDRQTGKRRAFVRFYACEQDLSNEPPDAPLPSAVAAALAAGAEPFLVVGAMAGG